MKKANIKLLVLSVLLMPLLTSCELFEGVFKAGMWSGILIVVAIIVLIIWLLSKLFSGRKK
ncbi:hypothetical protein C7377_0300 [Balneicella halophila]|uniref:Phosphatidate cytidylyltransferase n=1 Tax=Balneicella halophila TaxID=1537566 RepID=A0A7L4UQF3_BALHA|nr:hypothetical protein [Balneicella halophila]PVX52005.1 hypothetical protein C7377_0300 [Balneicella halophila]